MKAALEALTSIGQVRIEFTKKTAEVAAATAAGTTGDALAEVMAAHDKICTTDGSNTAIITFLSEMGDLPDVTVVPDGVDNVVTDTNGRGLSTKGTRCSC